MTRDSHQAVVQFIERAAGELWQLVGDLDGYEVVLSPGSVDSLGFRRIIAIQTVYGEFPICVSPSAVDGEVWIRKPLP